ncbi:hypothetical protein Gogos_018440 [Gossypium gossypioides]|uniref:ATP-dependent Clp protease proteolytic subunit n=1 Tax=Gossypium gossypioides TaxID=34282 RepID=A0A7J9BF80_GOSGO|nr:hypothetical protein [Gossypium gossypioides]
MVHLSIENDTKGLYLFVNSPDGLVIPGVAIYDTMLCNQMCIQYA